MCKQAFFLKLLCRHRGVKLSNFGWSLSLPLVKKNNIKILEKPKIRNLNIIHIFIYTLVKSLLIIDLFASFFSFSIHLPWPPLRLNFNYHLIQKPQWLAIL